MKVYIVYGFYYDDFDIISVHRDKDAAAENVKELNSLAAQTTRWCYDFDEREVLE